MSVVAGWNGGVRRLGRDGKKGGGKGQRGGEKKRMGLC